MANERPKDLPTPVAAKLNLIARHEARRADKMSTGTPGLPRVQDGLVPRNAAEDPLSISASYFILRFGLAILALAYPLVLILGSMLRHHAGLNDLQTSLSAYYHFAGGIHDPYGSGTMRDVFVGVLWAVGAFLVLYRGYSRREDVALDIAGLAAVLIAICPMDWPVSDSAAKTLTAKTHFVSAATFFAMIAYVCVRRADDTVKILANETTRRTFKRVYTALGIWMVGTPVAILVLSYVVGTAASSYKILAVEIAGVCVFAIFWLVKTYEILLIEQE